MIHRMTTNNGNCRQVQQEGMDEGQQLGRRLSFFDKAAEEEEEQQEQEQEEQEEGGGGGGGGGEEGEKKKKIKDKIPLKGWMFVS